MTLVDNKNEWFDYDKVMDKGFFDLVSTLTDIYDLMTNFYETLTDIVFD
eukprot:CAMPEP_0116883448 /NCGR_PEP_ID=MMETSP0463-20121206/15951_1 /TAXON_ID=181622 /ORGANISM="Strombidinopsis sp, Strain SopsisLIS2011" /LENGTH=48 /DNA_ID= /DNA_START= /DNA_END= /DNA_ORIENTATION=